MAGKQRGTGGPGQAPPLPSVLRDWGSDLGCHGPGSGCHCEEGMPRQRAHGGHHPPCPQVSCPARDLHPFPDRDEGWGGSSWPPLQEQGASHMTVAGTQKLLRKMKPLTHPALSRRLRPCLPPASAGPESIPAAPLHHPEDSVPWDNPAAGAARRATRGTDVGISPGPSQHPRGRPCSPPPVRCSLSPSQLQEGETEARGSPPPPRAPCRYPGIPAGSWDNPGTAAKPQHR